MGVGKSYASPTLAQRTNLVALSTRFFFAMAVLRSELAPTLFDDIRRDVVNIVNDQLADLVEDVERGSPKGVSSSGESLSGNYFLSPAQARPSDFNATVFNPLPFSLERLAGRGPGRQPPVEALRTWAQSKGLNPYQVVRGIGLRGTQRWRDGEAANVLRIDPRTKTIPEDRGPQKSATTDMLKAIDNLKY